MQVVDHAMLIRPKGSLSRVAEAAPGISARLALVFGPCRRETLPGEDRR